jgi:hypothetical protein
LYQYKCKSCGTIFEANRQGREYCSRDCQHKANNDNADTRLEAKPLTTAWSCGGGIDSTAIAALIVNGVLPKPELAYMTDCGWETEDTWRYMYEQTIPRLKAVGVTLEVIKTADDGVDTSKLVDGKGFVLIPAYARKDGKDIRYHTSCNNGWKVRIAQHWLRSRGVERCENWIGIAIDEKDRQHISPHKWIVNRYPLIELKMTREECLFYIGSSGWPRPTRTNCIICPQQNDRQWMHLKYKQPNDWLRAVEAERKLHLTRPDVFFHRSMVPLDIVEL